ncbi:MAG: hypothetical protein FWG77_05315 [Treponema sp.]|nr:hypothetical protein [Treponema sp.]
MDFTILRLKLASPLFYTPDDWREPFNCPEEGERLFCFTLDKVQGVSFEPKRDIFPGKLIFSGVPGKSEDYFELPEGDYYFSQEKRQLTGEEITEMAIEVQLETLWQRSIPLERMYLRFLSEDGNRVTQIFRPCKDNYKRTASTI